MHFFFALGFVCVDSAYKRHQITVYTNIPRDLYVQRRKEVQRLEMDAENHYKSYLSDMTSVTPSHQAGRENLKDFRQVDGSIKAVPSEIE